MNQKINDVQVIIPFYIRFLLFFKKRQYEYYNEVVVYYRITYKELFDKKIIIKSEIFDNWLLNHCNCRCMVIPK